MVLIAAGLAAIPRDALEAARIDGATEWQVFRKVTIPLLSPVLLVVFVTMIINVLKVFDLVFIIAPGSVQPQANVIALEMWRVSFGGGDNQGLGSALAIFLLVLVAARMIFNIRRFDGGAMTPTTAPSRGRRHRGAAAPPAGAVARRIVDRLGGGVRPGRAGADRRVLAGADARPVRGLAARGDGQQLHRLVDASFTAAGRADLQELLATCWPAGLHRVVLEHGAHHGAATLLVVGIASLAGVRVRLDRVPRPGLAVPVVVALLVVPVQVALIPVAKLYGTLGIFGVDPGRGAFHVAFGLPFAIFLLRNFFAGIPRDLLEAARMDGATEWTIFRTRGVPARQAGDRLAGDLPVPLGLERPARRAGVRQHRSQPMTKCAAVPDAAVPATSTSSRRARSCR